MMRISDKIVIIVITIIIIIIAIIIFIFVISPSYFPASFCKQFCFLPYATHVTAIYF